MLALAGAATAAAGHRWQRLDYPPLPMPGVPGKNLLVSVGSQIGQGDVPPVLRFDLMWCASRWEEKMPEVIKDPGIIAARLHRADGTIVEPKKEGLADHWTGVGGPGVTYSLIYRFPWQTNSLEEAWVELTLPGQAYWIEVPYGFTSDPAAPLVADAGRGQPAFPPTMKALGEKDRLVPWLCVHYDLGEIQNHWRLSLHCANGAKAWADAELYREDFMRRGGQLPVWQRDMPRTTMELRLPDGRVLASHPEAIRIGEDPFRRTDCYTLIRDALPEEGREWGRLVIKVDDKEYATVLPSSVFKKAHGATDSKNPKRIPVSALGQ